MNLIIVESPTKAKTIAKFVSDDYKILSSYGHVRDLPKSKLGIDVEHHFEAQYVTPQKAKAVLKELKSAAADSDSVILATDEDREGEAISWHLAQALKLDLATAKRIVFHEITKQAILEALQHPRTLDMDLVNAQQTRRILDRLVGYKLSPFLWKKVAKGLSAGRVQSVTVRLIADREKEIRAFIPQEYWSIAAHFQSGGNTLEANLTHVGEQQLEPLSIATSVTANAIVADLQSGDFHITSVEQKIMRRNPPAPFTTSTLQQEAAKRLHFSSQKTMLLAQRLYEHGLITYMRTDSTNLSSEALGSAKEYLQKTFGENYAAEAPRIFATKSRVAQEAHEAIRPTNISVETDTFPLDGVPEKKLYELIWQRFLASQMPKAVFDATGITIHAATPNGGHAKTYTLRANGTVLRFDGYLKIWPQKFEEKELPLLTETSPLSLATVTPEEHHTEPPPRYSEATLIKTLEKFGIGRPSTYAPTISVIQKRNYVQKEAGRFRPTELGELVNTVLTEHFPEIVDLQFTATMEDNLDAIANGKLQSESLLREFYDPFSKKLAEKYEVVQKTIADEPTNEICEKCGKPMIIKFGRFGKFMACSGFPDCKNTKKLAKTPPVSTGIKCPECAEGELVERRVSRGRVKGKLFWGCSRYPECKHAVWDDPRKPADNKEPIVTDKK